jgi:hypothetical protein
MKFKLNALDAAGAVFKYDIRDRIPSRQTVDKICGEKRDNTITAICAMPKSGSTFLSNVLAKALHVKYIPICFAYSSNEHDLYLPAMILAQGSGGVSQLHVKGTPHNARLFNLFRTRPVILVRNIYDALESLSRDLRAKEQMRAYGTGNVGYSFVWLDHNVAALDEKKLYDFVIDMALPWYVNFYVSWYRLEQLDSIKPLWVSYENLMHDKYATVKHILDELGYSEIDPDKSLLEKNYISGNRGIGKGSGKSGLGIEKFDTDHVKRIDRLISYYPDVDFTLWGLDA